MQTNQIASIMDSYLNTSKCLKRWSGDYLLLLDFLLKLKVSKHIMVAHACIPTTPRG